MRQAWQLLIPHFYPAFLDFFLPDWADRVDANRSPAFLPLPIGKKLSEHALQENLLLGIRLRDQSNGLLLWVLESGGFENEQFSQQLFRDFSNVLEEYEYKIPVHLQVLFLANSLPKIPETYAYEYFSTRLSLLFDTYIVREQYLDDLLEHSNPIAIAIAACRLRLENQQFPEGRLKSKLQLVTHLLTQVEKQQLRVAQRSALLYFIDTTIDLPQDFQLMFEQQLASEMNLKIVG